MDESNPKSPLEQGVMNAIRAGRVRVRPRWRFVLSGALAALGGIILLCTLLYIASFAFFTLRQSGVMFAPEFFGWSGVFEFFRDLPGILIVLLILFVVVLEVLVRRYRVGYRTPLLVSAVAIFAIVLLGGYALGSTRIHADLYRQAKVPGGLPAPIGALYRPGAMHVSGIYRGTITSMIPGGFLIMDENGAGTTTVIIGPGTRLPLGAGFAPGEEVVVFGNPASGTVEAFGVREVGN